MKRLHAAALTLVLAAGFAAAIALTMPAVAQAWDWSNLPNGYGLSSGNLGNGCYEIAVSGTPIGSTCDADFQQHLDAYIDSTICTVNPAAGQARGMCMPTTTVAADTTTSAAPPVGTTTSALPTETVPTTTVTVTVTTTDPTIETRVTALEAQYAALAKRVDAIAQANTASWTAFIDATNAGASLVDAALAARSAGMNAIYALS